MDKKLIIGFLKNSINEKINGLEKAIKSTQESANSESKSSMGDKYETARAMAQNDIDLYRSQLMETKRDQQLLENINFEQQFKAVAQGTFVETSLGCFFVAVSLGKAMIDNTALMFISIESPIGQKMKGLKNGDEFELNKKLITILTVS